MKSKKLLVLAFAAAVVAAVVLVVTFPAAAQDKGWHQLRGTYFQTGTTSCMVSSTGFTGALTPIPSPPAPSPPVVYFQTSSSQVTLKLNPDGTGTGQGSDFFVTLPPATVPSASLADESFPFTYSVTDERVLTVVVGTVTGTFTAGPFTGVPFSVTPGPTLTGRIGRNGTITLTSAAPAVETLTINFPPPPVSVGTVNELRICNRTRIDIRVHGADKE